MRRSLYLTAVGLCILTLSGASLAWACTQQARIMTLTPALGPMGKAVVVSGNLVRPGAPVDIRWNSLNGPTLATLIADPAGNFTGTITIPGDAPGIYTIIVGSDDFGVARTAFELTASPLNAEEGQIGKLPRDSASQELWSGFVSSPASASPGRSFADTSADTQAGSGRGLALGTGLMAAGTSALLAIALLRRQRKPAE